MPDINNDTNKDAKPAQPLREKNDSTNIIVANALSKRVEINNGHLDILQAISFTVKPGQSIAIVGSSGSGKSTLLALLAGLDTPTGGEVWLDNAPLHQMDEESRAKLRADKIGFIFQSFLLIPGLTALENVMLPAELAGINDSRALAEQWLEKVGLSSRSDHFPNQLSGGEQQRVAIARAFICQPKILFADEPTGNLDSENGERIAQLLFSLNQDHGTTLVLVTHDNELANRCQRKLTMKGGHLMESLPESLVNVG